MEKWKKWESATKKATLKNGKKKRYCYLTNIHTPQNQT
jgi:hypothetical protein